MLFQCLSSAGPHLAPPLASTLYPTQSWGALLRVRHVGYGGPAKVKVLVSQSCSTLCNPMNYSQPGYSVHGILQARILEWVAIPFFRASSQPEIKPKSPESPALQADSLPSET